VNARPTLWPRGIAWVQACGVLFLLAGLALAEGAAAANFLSKIPVEPASGILIAGALLYLMLAVAAVFALRWIFRRCGAGIFLGTAVGLSLLIQFSAIRAADPRWTWTGDSRIFEQYLTDLSATGYAPATLERLSQSYDYRVWTKRALPFYLALRVAAGERFAPAAQAFQAVLLALALLLSWRIARRLFGTRAAFWTVAFQWLMPYRWFICLDLNHHVLGGFYFLAGLGLLVEWLRPNRRPLATAGLALVAVVLLPLMRLEGGIDVVFAGAALLVLLLAWLAGRQNARQTLGSAVCLLAFPLLVSTRLLAPLEQRIEAADRHHLESGAIAFMARGWAPETGGEYCGTYETIDYLTARADKKSVQAAILASQAFYNPRVLLTQLLPTKMAKYFLLGYASGAEEMLDQNGAWRAAVLAEGARSAFLLAMLPLMLWGGWLLLPRLRRNRRLPLVAPCVLLAATYVLLGETSPRYSFYVQPFLFMLAALPFALPAAHRRQLARAAVRPGLAAALGLSGAFAILILALAAARPAWARRALPDMRTWSVGGAKTLDVPATLAPFEIRLAPQVAADGTTWGPIRLPALAPPPRSIAFYALPEDAPAARWRGATMIVEAAGRAQTNSLPARIRLAYPPSGLGDIRFRSPTAWPHPLRIGYATYEFHEKTTD